MPHCRHCEKRKSAPGYRGLCRVCHADPFVRDLYPSSHGWASNPDETMADLDRLVELMRPTMPKGEPEPRYDGPRVAGVLRLHLIPSRVRGPIRVTGGRGR